MQWNELIKYFGTGSFTKSIYNGHFLDKPTNTFDTDNRYLQHSHRTLWHLGLDKQPYEPKIQKLINGYVLHTFKPTA